MFQPKTITIRLKDSDEILIYLDFKEEQSAFGYFCELSKTLHQDVRYSIETLRLPQVKLWQDDPNVTSKERIWLGNAALVEKVGNAIGIYFSGLWEPIEKIVFLINDYNYDIISLDADLAISFANLAIILRNKACSKEKPRPLIKVAY